jgi:undecaprenyl diphosphate synthase
MHLLEQYMIEERSTIMQNNIRVCTIGRREGIPETVQREIDKTITLSSNNSGTRLCLAINYGGRSELLDAVRNIASAVRENRLQLDEISEQTIDEQLYTVGMSDPDLLIRTAGEMRISNFLLWQISYSEIWVTDRCWPEFREDDLHEAIRDYASRERRFGGLRLS